MTNKEAIDTIKLAKAEIEWNYPLDYQVAFDMAIKALEQEPCEDAISRQAVIDAIDKWVKNMGVLIALPVSEATPLFENIHKLPPVNPQPKTGHWIRWYEQKETERYTECIPHCKCSECGKEYDPYSSQFIKYCNECGAKMQEVEE